MARNILLVVIDCLRADHVYDEGLAFIPNMDRLRKEGHSFLNTIATTSTTTPVFASILTGLYPFETGVRSHSGFSMSTEVVTFPEILKRNGYNTYAEMTGPLVKEIGLTRGFDEYNHREREETIHTGWGEELLKRFEGHYKGPWFILLHIWPLHEPRIVIDECNHRRCGGTLYARALSSIDHYLGRLLKKVDDDTLVVVTGDHGEQISSSRFDLFWKKKRTDRFKERKKSGRTKVHFAKGIRDFYVGHGYSIYDVLVKVPLVFHAKDIVPKGHRDHQIRQIDIFPTIMDLVGIGHGERTTGRTLGPMIKGEDKGHRDAYLEAVGVVIPNKDEWLAGIRIDNRYKYIYSPFRDDYEEELYDLVEDPEERVNIASERREIVETCRKRIEAMRTEGFVGDRIDDDDQKKLVERLKGLGYMD